MIKSKTTLQATVSLILAVVVARRNKIKVDKKHESE